MDTIIVLIEYITPILTLLCILYINHVINKYNLNKFDKWNFIETIVALLFNWIGLIYVIIEYNTYLEYEYSHKEKK